MANNQDLENVLSVTDLCGNGVEAALHLSWSRAMSIDLGAKMKTGFINGKFPRPAEDDPILEKWIWSTIWTLRALRFLLLERSLLDSTS
ncbi:hypothetical protein Sjap_005556 [Stephania japonica]|uniref:Retrotransposon Copia-like N-terminal domain-containing protein n=1 Tax=Stephania japonica TaxID=461633 RepID=A0AAP0K5U1_9MAGN